MLHRLSQREKFALLIAEWVPRLKKVFAESVAAILDGIVVRQVADRLAQGDVFGAIAALGIEDADFLALDEEIRAAFIAGGLAAVESMPSRLRARFDTKSPDAERWLREHSAELITAIVAGIVESARSAMLQGLAEGLSPAKIVTRIVGRASRVTGKRQGSLIGLTAMQAEAVAKARHELAAGEYGPYLDRKRRDKRFDQVVKAALDEGKPIPVGVIDQIIGSYSDRLLDLRADVIAEDQAFTALGAATFIAFGQQTAKGGLLGLMVTKTWRRTTQRNPREQHIAMAGQTVRFDEDFIAPDGTRIPYPHASGIPANHRINCGCYAEYRISFAATQIF